MAESTPARKRTKAPPEEDLLAAACRIVASEGLAGLTLRPLAESLNVSVTVLSNHYGTRAEIIAAICRAAWAADNVALARWHLTLSRLGDLAAPAAADLADTILEELAVAGRELALLFLEALQASAWDEAVRDALAPWLSARTQFWRDVGRRAGLPPSLTDNGWLGAYFIDELAYSVVLNHLPSYRLLRRLCLRRLFSGLAPGPKADADMTLFAAMFDELEYTPGELAVMHGAQLAADWPGRAARACAMLLTERGVGALTHRAVAAAAEVPHTTLSYRFATQQDLVIAGLEYIISHLLQAVDKGALSGDLAQTPPQLSTSDGHGLDVGRATLAVAIAAARMPQLAPCAADMRRRRGINLVKILQRLSPPVPAVDLLSAQIIAIGMIGFGATLPADAGATGQYASVYNAVVDYMRNPQTFDQASPSQ